MPEIKLTSLTLSGFRAYLKPKTFDLSQKPSVAVFAPNGKGKSSIIDGMEFFLSGDGTLQRLGVRAVNNFAGASALVHNRAQEKGIDPFVEANFKRGNETFGDKRSAKGARERPAAANAVVDCTVVDPIIRGYELRAFVEDSTPQDRYRQVAEWLDLGSLVEVQTNLAALRRKVKAAAESDDESKRLDAQVARKTHQALKTWDGVGALKLANELVQKLDKALTIGALDAKDKAVEEIDKRAAEEERTLGLAALKRLRNIACSLYSEAVDDSGATTKAGLTIDLVSNRAALEKAADEEARERSAAANSAFEQLWKTAEPLFSEDAEPLDTCPICETPIKDTVAGNRETIHAHIEARQAELAGYAAAKKALADASEAIKKSQEASLAALGTLRSLIPEEAKELAAALDAYVQSLESWKQDSPPDATQLQAELAGFTAELSTQIARIEDKQGDATYAKAKALVQELVEFAAERRSIDHKLKELGKLSDGLSEQARFVSSEIRKKVEALLGTLQGPMNAIYKEIQRDASVPIRLELPAEDDTNQQRLHLVVDFAANRSGVQPMGYLSDSQIHSLALALRLAAINRCNAELPIIILDDIVTSYDADHRLAITHLLAKEFADKQVIIVTHDERFFLYLKDHLGQANWQYTRILKIDPDTGPYFQDNIVSDAMIEKRWADGESAANDMRQAEEEWLLRICREFGVDIRIRTVERAYSYERGELAQALANFLSSRKLSPPLVKGVNNRFLASLQQGAVENFGSHFQDAQYGNGSQGDEKVRWGEFTQFRDAFKCPSCERKRFKRASVGYQKPSCAHDGCETVFAFKEPSPDETEV